MTPSDQLSGAPRLRNVLVAAGIACLGAFAASGAGAQGVGTYVSTYSGLSGNRNFAGYNFTTDSQFNIFYGGGGASTYTACRADVPCATTSSGTPDHIGNATASFNAASLADTDQGGFSSGSGFARADLSTGELGGSADGTYRPVFGNNSGIGVRSFATLGDHLDFVIDGASASTVTDVTVNLVVHGMMSAVNQYVGPSVGSYLNFGGAVLNATLILDGGGAQVLHPGSGGAYWDSYTLTQIDDGFMFSGVYGLRGGTAGVDIGEFLNVGCGAGSTCDFGHTAALTLSLPTNVTFTSASGVFLSQLPGVVAPGAVPEPASWALMILGVGGVGAALRRRLAAVAAT